MSGGINAGLPSKSIRRLANETDQSLSAWADNVLQASLRPDSAAAGDMPTSQADYEIQRQKDDYDRDLAQYQKSTEALQRENIKLRTNLEESRRQNTALEDGLRDIRDRIAEIASGKSTIASIECPILERLLVAMETKNITGDADSGLILKAQLDNARGRNDELRTELNKIRTELTAAVSLTDKQSAKIEQLEQDNKVLRTAQESPTGGFLRLPLPEDMAPTSADLIAALNEQLVVVIQDSFTKDESLKKANDSLSSYKQKFSVMRHQMGVLYNEHLESKKGWAQKEQALSELKEKLDSQTEEKKIRLEEYDKLLQSLQLGEDEVKTRLAESSRTSVALRVNEATLKRKYLIIQETNDRLEKQNSKLQAELIQAEAAVSSRLAAHKRFEDSSRVKISILQQQLAECVPSSRLDSVTRQYEELTEKYRLMLDREQKLVETTHKVSTYEAESNRVGKEMKRLESELTAEKERVHLMEAALEQLHKQGIGEGKSTAVTNNELIALSKRLAMLEVKELNERQRADHAREMYDEQIRALGKLEQRNAELENKVSELTKLNLEAQKVEKDLRDELFMAVPKSVAEADKQKILKLETSVAELKEQLDKVKDMTDIAEMQARAFENQQSVTKDTMKALRNQVLDLQSGNDEKAIIGKLHRDILHLQISEGTARRKLEEVQRNLARTSSTLLKAEARIEEKERGIYRIRVETTNRIRQLKRAVHDLRRKFSGAVPLVEKEKLIKLLVEAREDRETSLNEMNKAVTMRADLEERVAQLELQKNGLHELMQTIQDVKGAQKVAEWHGRMEVLRAEDLRLKRLISCKEDQVQHLEKLNSKADQVALHLEDENVRLTKELEEQQLEWEQREIELERTVERLERQQLEISEAAAKFEETADYLPDPRLPLANQLEHSIHTIKQNVKIILETQALTKQLKAKISELEAALNASEDELISRDKVIAELRLHIPVTAGRDMIVAKAEDRVAMARQAGGDAYEIEQALRIAQSTVESLRIRANQKEQTILKYQQLLEEARAELRVNSESHMTELQELQRRLHEQSKSDFERFREKISGVVHKQTADGTLSNKQLARLNELEELVSEQEAAMNQLSDRVKHLMTESSDWRRKYEESRNENLNRETSFTEERQKRSEQMLKEIENLQKESADYQKKISDLEEELSAQKDANQRAPSTTMRNTVQQLRNQLSLKEKQQKALSKALMELRSDMVVQAEDASALHALRNQNQLNVQRVVEERTQDLRDRVQELEEQLNKSRKAVKLRKEAENDLSVQLEQLQHDNDRKERLLTKLRADRNEMEDRITELNKKIDRMNKKGSASAFETNRGVTDSPEMLRKRVETLEKQLEHERHRPEKPYDQLTSKRTDSSNAVSKWEDKKKLQQQVDRLKAKLQEKEDELARTQRLLDMNKAALDRANRLESDLSSRERDGLEAKIRSAPAVSSKPSSGAATRVLFKDVQQSSAAELDALKKKNFELEEELSNLKRHPSHMLSQLQQSELKIKLLERKITDLEAELSSKHGTSSDVVSALKSREERLQGEVLKLSEENLNLKFDIEQMRKDVPRLREKISDQEQLITLLKSEKESLQRDRKSAAAALGSDRSVTSSALGSPTGNVRRIGESGRSTKELERTIAALKKVVERVQGENEKLKMAPGIVSNDQLELISSENQKLKNENEELRRQFGGVLNERYTSQQFATDKISNEYEQLRKDHKKELDTNKSLQAKIVSLQQKLESCEREREELRSKLEVALARQQVVNGGSIESTTNKGWKNVVVSRMYEEKIRDLEKESERKVQQHNDMKQLLKDAALREQSLLDENKKLKYSSPQNLSGVPISSQTQNTQLQAEIRQLKNQLSLYKNQLGGGKISTEEVAVKLRHYDTVLTKNVELETANKGLTIENSKLLRDLEKMKAELSNFGPDFFEEIEDLKYNYKEAMQRNVKLEDKLQILADQFGVTVDVK